MKVALVCSHGGHLTQTLHLMEAFEGKEIFFCTFNSSRDAFLLDIAPAYFMKNYRNHIIRHIVNFFWAVMILIKEKPDVIVSLGADVAISFFVLAKIMRTKTLFIESWSRVDDLCLTGKLLYPIADAFWVQWPELLEKYGPKAEYMGAVV